MPAQGDTQVGHAAWNSVRHVHTGLAHLDKLPHITYTGVRLLPGLDQDGMPPGFLLQDTTAPSWSQLCDLAQSGRPMLGITATLPDDVPTRADMRPVRTPPPGLQRLHLVERNRNNNRARGPIPERLGSLMDADLLDVVGDPARWPSIRVRATLSEAAHEALSTTLERCRNVLLPAPTL